MIFRCKYLVAGRAEAIELYQTLKSELENMRSSVCDITEAEVLGPYPEQDGRFYPVVPVTFKFETSGYESEASVLFDLFMGITNIRGELAEHDFCVGLQEVVVDGERVFMHASYLLPELPVIEV